ncbi:MAG: hypothetical protein KDA69_01800 [Planctomycetaceae bacterium]|nr:hypothetical protein [Planctomycetaceae bacterium]
MRLFACCLLSLVSVSVWADEPISLGRSRELFVDDFLLQSLNGDIGLMLHQPKPKEVILVTDKPWEGNTCAYYTFFQDGEKFRVYYRGSHADEKTQKSQHPEVTCYAESTDGIHWTKPGLGLFDWEGSKANNIVWRGVGTHNFTPFKDPNPNAPAKSRYKALASGSGVGNGLYAFQSPDGIHWELVQEKPVITKGAFDSQNLAFWDPNTGLYTDYHRTFTNGVRAIMTCTSEDFVNWTDPVLLTYPEGTPNEHLYTNAIRIYPRAPHIRIGFPTRYQPKNSQVEPIFMSSRDGLHFNRWNDPVIPIDAPEERDGNRSNYMANGLLQLPGSRDEWSVYATESYYDGPDSRVRRFTYRLDGFTSLHAGKEGGEFISKPFVFEGDQLILNYRAAAAGEVLVELQLADGTPVDPFTLDECHRLTGDDIAQVVSWKQGDGLIRYAGKPVRLRIKMRNADIYSLNFRLLE